MTEYICDQCADAHECTLDTGPGMDTSTPVQCPHFDSAKWREVEPANEPMEDIGFSGPIPIPFGKDDVPPVVWSNIVDGPFFIHAECPGCKEKGEEIDRLKFKKGYGEAHVRDMGKQVGRLEKDLDIERARTRAKDATILRLEERTAELVRDDNAKFACIKQLRKDVEALHDYKETRVLSVDNDGNQHFEVIKCSNCEGKNEEIGEHLNTIHCRNRKTDDLKKEIKRLKKEVDVLTDVHSNMRTELRNVYGEIERLKSLNHNLAANGCHVRDTAEQMDAEIIKKDDEIERLKKRNLELHDSLHDALSGKLSGEGITFDGWPLSYWREMKEQNERLETAMTNLESQQEADTETAGILADVVDALYEDDSRCEQGGYDGVLGKAKGVVKSNHDLWKELESERSKNAGIADNVAAIKKTVDKLAKKKK